MNFKYTLYIEGEARQVTGLSGRIFADSKEMPGQPCAQYELPLNAESTLKGGMAIITSGKMFSLSPPAPGHKNTYAEWKQRMLRKG